MSKAIEAYYRHGHGDAPVRLSADVDVDAMVDALLAESFEYTIATLYHLGRPRTVHGHPDHELRVGIDAERGLGSLRHSGAAPTGQQGLSGLAHCMSVSCVTYATSGLSLTFLPVTGGDGR